MRKIYIFLKANFIQDRICNKILEGSGYRVEIAQSGLSNISINEKYVQKRLKSFLKLIFQKD